MKLTIYAKYAWGVLAYNLLVILWGAYVRATGSGAGCGSHWPLCNGEVIPRAPQVETLIEFSHRLTSGLALILVLILFVVGRRIVPKTHPLQLGVKLSLFFIVTEALVGAGLVLFQWVAYDASVGRVISISVHLVNTFLLLAALGLTAWWASGGEALALRGHGIAYWLFVAGFVGLLLIGVSGAITALGDTLFPVSAPGQGLGRSLDSTAHFLERLRIWHPVISIIVGVFLLFLAGLVSMFRVTPRIRFWAGATAGLIFVQWIAGAINIALAAPVWMQLLHLLLADLTWLAFVFLAAANFAESEVRQNVE